MPLRINQLQIYVQSDALGPLILVCQRQEFFPRSQKSSVGILKTMTIRRASISLKPQAALVARRVILNDEKLVYVLVANKQINYEDGYSRVVYIGTTRKGGSRIAQSVAGRAKRILALHGVTEFEARIVTCRRRQRVKMWHKLERAMLLAFREKFGQIPDCNIQGKNFVETDEFAYFAKARVMRILDDLSS